MSVAERVLVVEAGPLREAHYTGIPNVVAELCRRLLDRPALDVRFLVNDRWVDRDSLRACLDARSGARFWPSIASMPTVDDLMADLRRRDRLQFSAALYTERRPLVRVFGREALLLYDLSMLLTPECHVASSVAFFTRDLPDQVASSDLVFCISEATARDAAWLFKLGPERLRVALLGASVDVGMVERVRALAGPDGFEPFILVLGSIEPRKNVALVLEWIARHPEVLDRYRLVFAGRQAWGETLAEQVARRSLDGAVAAGRLVYLSFVDEKLKAALLAGASALLYPSVFEGFGLPLLEAMATGTPVLASASTSLPEVIGDDAYFFDPYSVASLQGAFERLCEDAANGKLASVVDGAKRRAATFTYDKMLETILADLL